MKEKDTLEQIEFAHKAFSKLKEEKVKKLSKKYSNIIFSSIGKSGIVERIVHDLKPSVPVEVSYEGKISTVKKRSLVIIITYSGATADIINFYKKVQGLTDNIVVVTSSEALAEDAEKNGYYSLLLENKWNSSNSLFISLYSTLYLLKGVGILDIDDVYMEESIDKVRGFSQNHKAIRFADALQEKVPVVYDWDEFSGVGFAVINYFNLFAKMYAVRSTIPEAEYNDVEALCVKNDCIVPVFIYPKGDEFKKAFSLMKYIKNLSSNEVLEFEMPEGNKLSQIVFTIMFFELVSEKIADFKGIEPHSRDVVEKMRHFSSDIS
ncbi:MAG: SIS domain-containing protein [Nanobdellota archaeon]